MQITKKSLSATKVELTIVVDQQTLSDVKTDVLKHLAKDHVKIQGFRSGKAPLSLVEKSVDQQLLQSEFLDAALNRAYPRALDEEKLRPVAQPEIKLTKFVPFTTLEFTAEVEVVGDIKLPDYKKVKVAKKPVSISAKDVENVLDNLKARVAEKKEVDRAAKDGDELTIDFAGTDAKTGEPIQGADGKDYPLLLGSDNFIPGFESNLLGMKAGEEKVFTITFPKDYGVAALQNRKVTFAVTVQKTQELIGPKVDDAFAATVGPFRTLAELKADIKKQVTTERENESERDFQNELLAAISDKTEAEIPNVLIENEIDRMEAEERQNLVYRGQTWEEHLQAEGVTNEEHRERQRDMASQRVKSGLMLAEVAEAEGIAVTDKEVQSQLAALKQQYSDPQMQSELDKPETRREIASRIVSEKTIAKLSDYATRA
jgi:trigger factor